jgi:hypothetical protein
LFYRTFRRKTGLRFSEGLQAHLLFSTASPVEPHSPEGLWFALKFSIKLGRRPRNFLSNLGTTIAAA